MRNVLIGVLVLSVAFVSARPSAQTPPPAGKVIATVVQRQFATVKRYISQSAELMAEADYQFKPQGTAADIRTFGAILAHVAGSSFVYCAAAKGVASPHAEDEFEKSATTRAAITKAVNEAMAYCDQAYSAYTDAQLSEMGNAPFAEGKAPRIQALLGNISHMNEHYGNLVTYFRAKGIVPPSSRGGGD
jgi:uncharacterized damage-inducible protein DinB